MDGKNKGEVPWGRRGFGPRQLTAILSIKRGEGESGGGSPERSWQLREGQPHDGDSSEGLPLWECGGI